MKFNQLAGPAALLALAVSAQPAVAQRVLGLDVSYYQGNIAQSTWNNIHGVDNRQFVFIRSTRGGTTGEDHRQGGYPAGNNSLFTLSQRYDDPYYVQNITRATAAGLFAGSYHFSRADVAGNNGADEADHFMQMGGAWMRPGYLPPVFDLESGAGSDALAQYALDFSNRIHDVMGIRPAMYLNGNYSNILQGATSARRDQLALPVGNQPSVVSPAFPVLWNARYAGEVGVQDNSPRDTASTFYGPWDDYGDSNPWDFWQYSNTGSLQTISPVDLNVSHGDIEYLKDQLIPAVWMNDASGDWGTLVNWNSGQPSPADPQSPTPAPGMLTRVGPWTPPAPRLPGAAGSGPTSGQNDTVILERPNADITVTISGGTHNVRKLYMRETLNITGGSLTINYDPEYATPVDSLGVPLYPNAYRSGGPSAQFSGDATLGGSGSLTVHTLQVDPLHTFTLAGSTGELTFRQIQLVSAEYDVATLAVTGNVNIKPLAGGAATITTAGVNYYSPGTVDLNGGNRTFSVSDGASDVDLSVDVPIVNGALTKSGPGTMRLNAYSSYSGGTTVEAGRLELTYSAGSVGSGGVTVNGGILSGSDYITGDLLFNGGVLSPGSSLGVIYAHDGRFNPTSAFNYEYDSKLSAADSLNLSGNLYVGGNVALNLTNLGAGKAVRGSKFTLISYDGLWNNGAFTGFANNAVFNSGPIKFRIQYDDTSVDAVNGGAYAHAVTLTALNGPTAVTINGFVEDYAPANWTIDDANAHGGFVDLSGAPSSIRLVGPDGNTRVPGQIGYVIQVPTRGLFSFDWSYFSTDDPNYDYAYFVNGFEYYLSQTSGESGHVSIPVAAGDLIGWRVYSSDSVAGAGVLTINNFSVPALVPEPTTTLLALVGALVAGKCRRGRVRRVT